MWYHHLDRAPFPSQVSGNSFGQLLRDMRVREPWHFLSAIIFGSMLVTVIFNKTGSEEQTVVTTLSSLFASTKGLFWSESSHHIHIAQSGVLVELLLHRIKVTVALLSP